MLTDDMLPRCAAKVFSVHVYCLSSVQRMHDPLGKVQRPHGALEAQLPAQGGVQQAVATLECAGEHAAGGQQVGTLAGDVRKPVQLWGRECCPRRRAQTHRYYASAATAGKLQVCPYRYTNPTCL